ncbi:MAG: ParB/RepB/Spo0J family partition protein [Bacteroidetes bacterium]|nr:ParB/RepB/Spo0J family partition protein [Bacteroidota bacterium]
MKSNVRLGRGLDALIKRESVAIIGPSEGTSQPEASSISKIGVRKIRANKFQPRKEFAREGLEELKSSIRENGLIQPITVRRVENGMFELISGERRLRAVTELGLEEIASYVLEITSDTKMLELALTENLQREDLNAIEVATGYQRLIDECSLTQEQVAGRVGKDRATVANFLRLLRLPAEIQKSLISGAISAGHARALLAISDQEEMLRLFKKVVQNNLSVRQVEREVRHLLGKSSKQAVLHPPRDGSSTSSAQDATILDLTDRLRRHLATKVKINYSDNHAGEIRIEFYADGDLERIIELILSDRKE